MYTYREERERSTLSYRERRARKGEKEADTNHKDTVKI